MSISRETWPKVSPLNNLPAVPAGCRTGSIETFSVEIAEVSRHLSAFGWQAEQRHTWVESLEALILSRLERGVTLLRWALVRFEQDHVWAEGAYLKGNPQEPQTS